MKKIFQIIFSTVLIYFALREINVRKLFFELLDVPLLLIIFTLLYGFLSTCIVSWRWSLILLKKTSVNDVLIFVKCSYLSFFYGLLLPTSLASDLIKWLPLVKKYPKLDKIKIVSSVLIDRVIGATAFFPIALVSLLFAKMFNYDFPNYLLLIFSLGCVVVIIFYFILFYVDFDKVFKNCNFLDKLLNVMDLIKKENKSLLIKCFIISVVVQVINIFSVWMYGKFLGVNFSLNSVFIFIPIISLALLLPISIAGFGAREQLYLFFFSQLGIPVEKILLVAAYSGIMGVVMALFGGILIFF